jgi:uncharacterized protein with HEPN domain
MERLHLSSINWIEIIDLKAILVITYFKITTQILDEEIQTPIMLSMDLMELPAMGLQNLCEVIALLAL